jgi:hypothetical protein
MTAESAPASVDIAPLRAQGTLEVLTDGAGHYIVVAPFDGPTDVLFYGDQQRLYRQRVFGGGSSGRESYCRTFWEPRGRSRNGGELSHVDGRTVVRCDARERSFTPLPAAEVDAWLAKARLFEPLWSHRAYALARDTTGRYYYVDRLRDDDRPGFRLFAGKKGQLKPTRMVNVVSDSAGDIFATQNGQLRLVLGRGEATWIRGQRTTTLTLLPVEDNVSLIYGELGVYLGLPLGTPCDDL